MRSRRARNPWRAVPWALVLVLLAPGERRGVRAGDEDLPPPVVIKRRGGVPVRPPPRRARPRPPPAPQARPRPVLPPAPTPGALPPPVVRRRGAGPPPSGRTLPPAAAGGRELPPRPSRPGRPPMPGSIPQPPDDVPLTPPPRPEIPPGAPSEPGEYTLDVARAWTFPDSADGQRLVHVMTGAPWLRRPGFVENGKAVEPLSIKANTLVLWADRRYFDGLDLQGLGARGGEDGGRSPPPRTVSVIPAGLLGIYAEGAVELVFGTLTFRARQLYLDPHEYKALLIEPRFDGRAIGVSNAIEPLPLHVRARRARLVAKGVTHFQNAEVSASRAEDRIMLRVEELSVREYEEGAPASDEEAPHLLGYHGTSSQWYSGRTITGHGERVPLFWLPAAEFGISEETQALTQPIKRLRTGRISQLGRFAFLRVGDTLGPDREPWADWFLEAGGYTKRGAGAGADLTWRHMDPGDPYRGFGSIESWFVLDHKTVDSDDFRHGRDVRGRVVAESRTYITSDLLLDVEFAEFSDRGFNNEFFERDDLQHKDRESYGRLRWAPARPGTVVATLDGKWHQRSFATETTQLPEAGLWVLPAPLLVPRRRGGLAMDLTSMSRAGFLRREMDVALFTSDYEAWRLHSDTRVNMGMDAGDVRLSGYLGGTGTVYDGRTDGGADLERTALLAGTRANLQLHRLYAVSGGWFQLDGLRHVMDLDAEYAGRFYDSYDPVEVPFFDLLDEERERSAFIFRLRNRLQTRRTVTSAVATESLGVPSAPRSGGLRTVADLEIAVKRFVDDVGPFGRTSPGTVELSFYGQPRETLDWAGEAEIDWRRGVETASFGVGVRTSFQEKPLAIFGGARYVRDRSFSLTADVSWRFSDRYGLRLLEIYDFDEGQNLTRILFRRYSPDHIIVFGVSVRNQDDVGIEFSIEPAIGGRTTEGPAAFKDEPDLNPWGALNR